MDLNLSGIWFVDLNLSGIWFVDLDLFDIWFVDLNLFDIWFVDLSCIWFVDLDLSGIWFLDLNLSGIWFVDSNIDDMKRPPGGGKSGGETCHRLLVVHHEPGHILGREQPKPSPRAHDLGWPDLLAFRDSDERSDGLDELHGNRGS